MAEVTNPNDHSVSTVQTGIIEHGATVTIPDEVAATLPDSGVLHIVFADIKNDWRVAIKAAEDEAKKVLGKDEAAAKTAVDAAKAAVVAPAAPAAPAVPVAS